MVLSAALLGTITLAPVQGAIPFAPSEFGARERLAGNPLAGYAEVLRREGEFASDPARAQTYWEIRAALEERLGDPGAVGRGLAAMLGDDDAGDDLATSPLAGYEARPAVVGIVRALGERRVLMIGEEHHSPQSRAIAMPLLRSLRARGFRYYAAETFSPEIGRIQRQGYPDYRSGDYTDEPVFAETVREAIRLSYTLVPYEATPSPPGLSVGAAQEWRERGQAENLKRWIFDRDPGAKVLVHAGRGHIGKGGGEFGGVAFRLMGAHFRELTGIDPLSIYCASAIEHEGRPRQESPLYRYVTACGLVRRPTVFVRRDGRLWPGSPEIDGVVFFPRVALVAGRPDWMMLDLGRRLYRIPFALERGSGLRLVQARPVGEPETSIPTDQVLLGPGIRTPGLMLPPGRYRLRTIDPAGAELAVVEARV